MSCFVKISSNESYYTYVRTIFLHSLLLSTHSPIHSFLFVSFFYVVSLPIFHPLHLSLASLHTQNVTFKSILPHAVTFPEYCNVCWMFCFFLLRMVPRMTGKLLIWTMLRLLTRNEWMPIHLKWCWWIWDIASHLYREKKEKVGMKGLGKPLPSIADPVSCHRVVEDTHVLL